MRILSIIWLVLGSHLGLTAALGGGFQTGEHSARALGMGGAIFAAPNDAGSLYANPSAFSFLSGTHLSVGATVMIPENKFTFDGGPGTTEKMQSQVIFPPNFSLCHTFPNGFGVGIGASIPFAMRNEWSNSWPAGRISTRSEVRMIFVSPALSVKLMPSLSIGVSLNVAFARLQETRRIGFDDQREPDGGQSLDGQGKTAYGFQAGVLFHPNELVSLGASYRSRIAIPVEGGSVTFNGIPASELPNFPNGAFSTSITTPDHIGAGLGLQLFPGFYIGGDVQYLFWSSLSSLTYTFADPLLQANASIEKSVPMRWKNSFNARAGIEVTISDVDIRAGYEFEQTPVPAEYMRPSAPDADRTGYSGGIGYAVSEGLHLDFGCAFIQSRDRQVSNSAVQYKPGASLNGTYSSSLTMVSINVSYSWN